MKLFTKNEALVVTMIFLAVFFITALNMRLAIQRSRDAQRMSDIGMISEGLNKFREDYGFFPPSENGKIKACKADNFDELIAEIKSDKTFERSNFFSGLKACEWGSSSLEDLLGERTDSYIKNLPLDPKAAQGMSYLYLSDEEYFQLYSTLEGEDREDSYSEDIVKRNLYCGNKICSYGKSYGDIPLDISIDEYRIILREKQTTGNMQ